MSQKNAGTRVRYARNWMPWSKCKQMNANTNSR